MTLHSVQEQILLKLMLLDPKGVRYSEVQMPEIENDLFNYHLQTLVKNGYLVKNDGLYKLTDIGKRFVSEYSYTGELADRFKVSVIAYVIKGDNQILLQRRLREPFVGDVTNIAGKVKTGELAEAAAARKLKAETGLVATFEQIGVLRKIKRDAKSNLLEDVIYHLCLARNPRGELSAVTEAGENFWASIEEAIEYENSNKDFSPKTIEIFEKLKRDKLPDFGYMSEETKVEEY